jgi:FkbM family methyltransferase
VTPIDRARARARRAIGVHWRSLPVRGALRVAHGIQHAADNVSHDLFTNGEAVAVQRHPGIALALDVGAFRAEWTGIVRAAHPRARIHAFEPTPATAERLAALVADDELVTVHRCALGSRSGPAPLHVDPERPNLNSLLPDSAPETVTVEVVRGDDVLAEEGIGHVDFLKIDSEGGDFQVLEGFGGALEAGTIDVLEFEYNRWNITARRLLADFYELLEPCGYTIGKVHPDGVDFADYSPALENWRGPACIAVRRARADLVDALRCR